MEINLTLRGKTLVGIIPPVIKGENRADAIAISIPKQVGSVDMTQAQPMFHWLNPENKGNVFEMKLVDCGDTLTAMIPITIDMTAVQGNLVFWLVFVGAGNELVLKSQPRALAVARSFDVAEVLTEQQLGLLEQWEQRMTGLDSKLQASIDKIDSGQLKGDQGEKGEKGDVGAQGLQGIQGEKGDKGEKGEKGNTGAQGLQGIQGVKGEKGDVGAQGLRGLQGEKGDTGEKGEKGDTGAQGLPGESGKKLIARYEHTSNTVIQPIALDLETGVFTTAEPHGLTTGDKLAWVILNVGSRTTVPVPFEIWGKGVTDFACRVISDTTFVLTLTGADVLYQSAENQGKTIDLSYMRFEKLALANVVLRVNQEAKHPTIHIVGRFLTSHGFDISSGYPSPEKNSNYWGETKKANYWGEMTIYTSIYTPTYANYTLNTLTCAQFASNYLSNNIDGNAPLLNKTTFNQNVKLKQPYLGAIGSITFRSYLGSFGNGTIIEIYEGV